MSNSNEKFKGFIGKNCYCYFPGVSLSRILSWKVCKQVTTQPENCIDDWINHWLIVDYFPKVYKDSVKGGLISKGSLNSAPLPSKGAKSLSWAENLNKLLYWYGQEIQIFCSGEWFGPFVANGTQVNKTSEIKLPLTTTGAA